MQAIDRSLDERMTEVLLEYAQKLPATRPFEHRLSLRDDLAIESLSLVSLTLRLGDEFGVDVMEMGLELGKLETVGDLVALGRTMRDANHPTHQKAL